MESSTPQGIQHAESTIKPNVPKPYLLSFNSAMKIIGLDGTNIPDRFELTREQLMLLLTAILRGAEFDERWYCSTYPDIADAVASGTFRSARRHFIEHGYVEGRSPTQVKVDDDWYMEHYPDVADGVYVGEISSCQDHFERHGKHEGRFPYET